MSNLGFLAHSAAAVSDLIVFAMGAVLTHGRVLVAALASTHYKTVAQPTPSFDK